MMARTTFISTKCAQEKPKIFRHFKNQRAAIIHQEKLQGPPYLTTPPA
jgi:hypothetical protein